MPAPTVYIETTIVSYLTAWPSRDIVRAAHQQLTRDWWATWQTCISARRSNGFAATTDLNRLQSARQLNCKRMTMTNEDPIVEEVRRAGDTYMKQFDYDLHAVFADLRRRTEEARLAGRKVVSLPARRVTPIPAPIAKKAS
jgi:hypothetical protein